MFSIFKPEARPEHKQPFPRGEPPSQIQLQSCGTICHLGLEYFGLALESDFVQTPHYEPPPHLPQGPHFPPYFQSLSGCYVPLAWPKSDLCKDVVSVSLFKLHITFLYTRFPIRLWIEIFRIRFGESRVADGGGENSRRSAIFKTKHDGICPTIGWESWYISIQGYSSEQRRTLVDIKL